MRKFDVASSRNEKKRRTTAKNPSDAVVRDHNVNETDVIWNIEFLESKKRGETNFEVETSSGRHKVVVYDSD